MSILIGIGLFYVYGIPFFKPGEITSNTQPKGASAPAIVNTRVLASGSTTTTKNYILPSSKVNAAYTSLYNAVANETIVLENSYKNELNPLLVRAQAAVKSKDYRSLSSIGEEAKVINNTQKARLTTLSTNLDNLSVAAKTLTDSKTISLTNDSVAAGKNYVAKYVALSALIDDVTSGRVSAQTVTVAKSISGEISLATKSFFDANKKLSDYFIQTIESDANALLSSETTQSR